MDTMKITTAFLSAALLGIAPLTTHAQGTAVPAAEAVFLDDVSTVAETNALITSINKYRSDLGLSPLAVNADLSEWAAGTFPKELNPPRAVDVTELRKTFGATQVGILRGVLTHRGAKSGGEFPKYWAKDAQWKALMEGDFTHIGAATMKRSDGKLVAFVYLIRK